MSEEPIRNADLTDSAEVDPKRVYFGNVAYGTTEEQLKEFIKPAGASASKVELPTRGGRPGGFAFASFESEEDAKKVVEKLAGLSLNDRPVSLAIAKSDSDRKIERAEKLAAQRARRAARPKSENADGAGAATATEGEGADSAVQVEGEAKPKKKRSSKKRPARRLPEEGGEDAPTEETAATTLPEGETAATAPKKARKPRKPRGPKAAADANGNATEEARIDDELGNGEEAPVREKKERVRKPRTELSGEPSKTLLFVANLPFSVDDAALSEIFTSAGIQVTTARVVRVRAYAKQKAPPRSKGFGFVEVADEKAQQLALDKLQGHVVEEREISIKIANERVEVPDEQGEEATA